MNARAVICLHSTHNEPHGRKHSPPLSIGMSKLHYSVLFMSRPGNSTLGTVNAACMVKRFACMYTGEEEGKERKQEVEERRGGDKDMRGTDK